MTMSFSIECAQSFSSANASESDIQRAFDDDAARGEYIILTADDGSYIQASGEGDGPYTLEYRNAGESVNHRADEEPSKQQVREAFLQYLRGDAKWRTSRKWTQIKTKSGCMTVLLIAVAMLGGVAILKLTV
jgi:hypothetical protein